MAIVGGASQHRLAPLYDPAPMRAYRGRVSHNILSALPASAKKNSLAPAIDGFRITLHEVKSSVLS
jgi:hypothetical protein